jgi:CspA family cold shock protein
MDGTVLSFSRSKGWGFALPDDGSNDVFLHRSNLPNERKYLNEGDRISYELGERNGRPLALNIQVIASAPPSVHEVLAAPDSGVRR